MAFNLKKNLIRMVVTQTAICFAVGIALSWFANGVDFQFRKIIWLIALALGIGVFSAWKSAFNMRKNLIKMYLIRFH